MDGLSERSSAAFEGSLSQMLQNVSKIFKRCVSGQERRPWWATRAQASQASALAVRQDLRMETDQLRAASRAAHQMQ